MTSLCPGSYESVLSLNKSETYVRDLQVLPGSVSTVVISGENLSTYNFILTSGNSVHILWQVPQYLLMATSEVMFAITGLEFSYSMAPTSMKAMIQAFWCLTVGFGNIFVMIFADAQSRYDLFSQVNFSWTLHSLLK